MNTSGMTYLEIAGRAARRLSYGSGPAWNTDIANIWRWIIENIHPQLPSANIPAYCFKVSATGQTCVTEATLQTAAASAMSYTPEDGETAIQTLTLYLEWNDS